MPHFLTRRQLAHATASTLLAACAPRPTPTPHSALSFADLEQRIGGRVGVFALDTSSGRWLAHRAEERFAMCSTFKWLLAAAVLARIDRGTLAIHDRIAYSESDLLQYAPVTRRHVADANLSVEALAEAAVRVSDNTAANLLLATIGGPSALTQFARSCGDPVTRLDRNEPDLNTNVAGDPRDTTSPRAMATLLRTVLCGDVLSTTSRELLLRWLRACETGADRLRAGLPSGWRAGDKTGTGERGAVHDVAIVWPPARAPLLLAAYLSDSDSRLERLVATHADIAKIVVDQL